MGQAQRTIAPVGSLGDRPIARDDADQPSVRVPDGEALAAARLGERRDRRDDRAACRLRGGRDALQISCAVRPERDVAKRRLVSLVQR